jgi:hypothetical protein
LQGYLCNENLEDIYVLGTKCGSAENSLLIGLSSVFLLIYFGVFFTERLFNRTREFENNVPWGSLETN